MQPAPAQSVPGTRFRLAAVAETGSTNVDLAAWIRDGLRPDYVLRTDHQTAGRGRRDRTWEAPPGSGLMMSVALAVDEGVGRSASALASAGPARRCTTLATRARSSIDCSTPRRCAPCC